MLTNLPVHLKETLWPSLNNMDIHHNVKSGFYLAFIQPNEIINSVISSINSLMYHLGMHTNDPSDVKTLKDIFSEIVSNFKFETTSENVKKNVPENSLLLNFHRFDKYEPFAHLEYIDHDDYMNIYKIEIIPFSHFEKMIVRLLEYSNHYYPHHTAIVEPSVNLAVFFKKKAEFLIEDVPKEN